MAVKILFLLLTVLNSTQSAALGLNQRYIDSTGVATCVSIGIFAIGALHGRTTQAIDQSSNVRSPRSRRLEVCHTTLHGYVVIAMDQPHIYLYMTYICNILQQ